MKERNVKNRSDPSPSLLAPLLAAAVDEDREELRKLWVKLLAALLDPDRSSFFISRFIDVTKKMDPLDARVLEAAHGRNAIVDGNARQQISGALTVLRDQVDVAVENLIKLELLSRVPTGADTCAVSAFGREFLRAVK